MWPRSDPYKEASMSAAILTKEELDLELDNPAGDLDAELSELYLHEATGTSYGESTICTQWSAKPRFCCC